MPISNDELVCTLLKELCRERNDLRFPSRFRFSPVWVLPVPDPGDDAPQGGMSAFAKVKHASSCRHHRSDRGVKYAGDDYRALLAAKWRPGGRRAGLQRCR
jgi:hypothetical protein